jgi:hypothetical protein
MFHQTEKEILARTQLHFKAKKKKRKNRLGRPEE